MGKSTYLLAFKHDLYDRIIQAAKEDGVSIAHFMREALGEKLKRRDQAKINAELEEAYKANNYMKSI